MQVKPSAAVYRRAAQLLEQNKAFGIGNAVHVALIESGLLGAQDVHIEPLREMAGRTHCPTCHGLHGQRRSIHDALYDEPLTREERQNLRITWLCFTAALAEAGDL